MTKNVKDTRTSYYNYCILFEITINLYFSFVEDESFSITVLYRKVILDKCILNKNKRKINPSNEILQKKSKTFVIVVLDFHHHYNTLKSKICLSSSLFIA